jgi:transposase InsO family protein
MLLRIKIIQIRQYDWKLEQEKCNDLKQIKECIIKNKKIEVEEFMHSQLLIRINKQGLLVNIEEERLVVPKHLRNSLMKQCHDHELSGHFGRAKTLKRIRANFYLPLMSKEVENYVKNYHVCQMNKQPTKQPKAKLQSIQVNEPWQTIALDIVGPIRTNGKNLYLFVAIDLFTKYCIAEVANTFDAARTCKFIFESIICVFGTPREILTDQGTNFDAQLTKELCDALKIEIKHSTTYHPMCNWQVERQNKTLITMLKCYVQDNPHDWSKYINQMVFAYNTTPHSST